MAKSKDQSFNYDDAPKTGFLFPKGYAKVEVESHEVVSSQAGNRGYVAVGRIVDAGNRQDDLEGSPVYLRFYVGHEDDPDAEDPTTWTKANEAKGSKFAAAQMISFLKGCELTKGEGRGAPPWELFEDVDGCTLIVGFSVRTNRKSGDEEQSFNFFKEGDREPEFLEEGKGGGRKKRERPADDDDDTADEPPKKRRLMSFTGEKERNDQFR